MAITKAHLDELLNTTIPYANFQPVNALAYTTTSSNAAIARINSLSVTVQNGQPLGIYQYGPYTITAIDDINNTFLATGSYPGAGPTNTYSILYYVLGYANGSVIFGARDSVTTAGYAATSSTQLSTNIGILSPSPVAAGTNTNYYLGSPNGPPKPFDFTGNGKADILFQNDSGAVVLETTTNLSITGGGLLSNPGPAWHLVASADFNGDGYNDVLFQNDNGAIVDYLMNGTTVIGGYSLTNPGPSWHLRGVGDFNADLNADLVLQNDNGTIVIEYTNGTTVTGGATISAPGPNWTVEGVADFNGDGQPDLLLQNTDGQLVDFLMNGTTIAAGYQLIGPNVGYSVTGTGDYNGDGRSDILLHSDSGQDLILYTNGQTSIGTSVPIPNPGPSSTTFVGGIDFNGDGHNDLLVGNTAGNFTGYTLDAFANVTATASLTNPGPGWRALGNNPMQFIDGTGAAPTLAGTPGVDEFNFTTFTAGVHTITNFDAAIDLIALSATSIGSYANVQPHESAYNGGTAIGLSASTAIFIQGIAPTQLSAANFVFR